jgi:4-coumarate--CoA ligase
MASTKIIAGSFAPLVLNETITIPQFMTRYNPDNVPTDKIVHTDTISGKSITYGGLRKEAAKCAWGLQAKLDMKEQDVLLVLAPNSVNSRDINFRIEYIVTI